MSRIASPSWLWNPFAGAAATGGTGSAYVDATWTVGEIDQLSTTGIAYSRAAGIPIRLTPTVATAIDGSKYEVRVGVNESDTFDSYTVALGNLSGDFSVGEIIFDPTAAETVLWSLIEPMSVQLWHTGDDDETYIVRRWRLAVRGSLR